MNAKYCFKMNKTTKIKGPKSIIVPPDGGYGWMIVFAATFLRFIASSSVITLGLYMVEWIEYFQKSKTELFWIGSAQLGIIVVAGKKTSHDLNE